jgi:hypothetical protein
LVTFFDVVTFFGVAAFFAWLGFLPLLNDLLPKRNGETLRKARSNLITLSDYFLLSSFFFAAAVLCDYAFHNGGSLGLGFFFHSFILEIVIIAMTALGAVNLLIPIRYLRMIWKGDNDLASIKLLAVRETLLLCHVDGSRTVLFSQCAFPI